MLSKLFKQFGSALALSCLLGFTTSASAQNAKKPDHIPGELIVHFKATATDTDIAQGMKRGHLKVKRHVQTQAMKARGHHGITLVETDLDLNQAIQQLQNDPSVEYVEPNYTYKHQLASNDPYVTGNYTWGLYSALSSPANSFGSGAADAWSAGYTGTNGVYVAVIDEGIDVAHPDLSQNIWANPFDPIDGIDNDGNGYVDDVNGWNFYDGNNQVTIAGDQHGTHVAGTIGATGGNGVGVAGVNWNVTIISGRFLGEGGGDTLAAVEAIDYFIDLKKRHNLNLVAINASWGGGGYSRSLHDSIIRAAKAGIIFVAAAGNEASNNDLVAAYPANIDTTKGTYTESAASFNGVISVAAIDSTGALASFSNYGAKNVHIGAPGVQILSTLPGSQLGYMSGTSMATPHVAGAVALYASTHPGASAQSIRSAIIGSVSATPSLSGKTTTGGRLNISSVIKPVVVAPTGPAAPTGLTATVRPGAVDLKWTAVTGATSYTVKRSTAPAGVYTALNSSVTATTFTDSTVNNGTTYYYVVNAVNADGTSPNSSEVSATPQAPVAAPTGVTASAAQATVAGNSTVTIRWNAVTAATGYKVKRATSSAGPWAVVASGSGTSYSQSVTANGTTYFYRVVATGSSGDSVDSASASVAPASSAPAGLAATALSTYEVQLAWTDRSADEQGFKLEYWNGSQWVQFGSVGAGATVVKVTGTSSKATYYFRIRAYNGTSNTAYSNTAAVTMP